VHLQVNQILGKYAAVNAIKTALARETPDKENIATEAIAGKRHALPCSPFASRITVDYNMSIGPAGKSIGSFSLLAGLLLAGSASANPYRTVTVNGRNYRITSDQTPPLSAATMPWTRNSSLAGQFATSLGDTFNTTNPVDKPLSAYGESTLNGGTAAARLLDGITVIDIAG